MKYIVVDIEADGPIPGDFSMIEIGATVVHKPEGSSTWTHDHWTYFDQLRPISNSYSQEALNAIGRTRAETMSYHNPKDVIENFAGWAETFKRTDSVRFVSDNAGFDWMFVCWYIQHYLKRNPFGFSCDSLTSLYKGYARDMRKDFRKDGYRGSRNHTHNALEDAKGNSLALCRILNEWGQS